jgi:Zn-dependent peptidase ImmA (M78 family)/transcriptional regulator with XRE-family HTH domain
MDIGTRLKSAREAIGYTLEKVEKESGIGVSSLSEFENEKREPKFSQLSRLAEIYKRNIDFFLTDNFIADPVMLWRDGPNHTEEKKETEMEFQQLCQQYHKLELCTGEIHKTVFPQSDITNSEQFNWPQAELFARKVQKELCLGDIPSTSLKKILEERYYVKIFHLDFPGSAVSTNSQEFGPAVLLNRDKKTKQWRRNFDLAHELFHLLTWHIFRTKSKEATDIEEKLANFFASTLLMPEDFSVKVRAIMAEKEKITFDEIDNWAREYEVSFDAVLCRIASIFRMKKEDTDKYRSAAKNWATFHKHRESDEPEPETRPERYCDLAQRALKEGKLSLMQFAKYMGISYKKAQEYMTEDEGFTDEKITIPVA